MTPSAACDASVELFYCCSRYDCPRSIILESLLIIN